MRAAEREARLRELELFRPLRLLPGAWAILRLDGRGFGRWIAGRFAKPYDEGFRDLMEGAAEALLRELQGFYAYTMSDEISLLLTPAWDLFGRRLEKVVSISAGIASAVFTKTGGEAAHFDSRAWLGPGFPQVVDYFLWRQAEAARNARHSWCFWSLRQSGLSARQADDALRGRGSAFQNELLFRQGINFNDLPAWQRRGVGICWESCPKEGFDPRRGEPTMTTRRRVKIERELPMKEEYASFLRRLTVSGGDTCAIS